MMLVRGVRGAITVEDNSAESILEAVQHLLSTMIEANGIQEDQVASVMFTSTPDLNAAYPAKAARLYGWSQVALMGFQEIDVPGGLPMCVRVLIHWNTDKSLEDIQHIFLDGAAALRPDIANRQQAHLNGGN